MPPDTARNLHAPSGNSRQVVCPLAPLRVTHVITPDDEIGQAPPPNDGTWCAVRRVHGYTLWRKLSLKT